MGTTTNETVLNRSPEFVWLIFYFNKPGGKCKAHFFQGSHSNFTTKNTNSTKGKIRKDFNYLLFLYFIFVSFVSFVVQNPK